MLHHMKIPFSCILQFFFFFYYFIVCLTEQPFTLLYFRIKNESWRFDTTNEIDIIEPLMTFVLSFNETIVLYISKSRKNWNFFRVRRIKFNYLVFSKLFNSILFFKKKKLTKYYNKKSYEFWFRFILVIFNRFVSGPLSQLVIIWNKCY